MSTNRTEIINTINETSHRLGNATVQYHQAAAERFGLNATDMKTLPLLSSGKQVIAGDIAHTLGLTTGAVTNVIDRLVAIGLVRRCQDPHDRRKVIVELIPEGFAEVAKVYEPFMKAMQRLFGKYTDEQLVLITDFLEESTKLLEQGAARLRHGNDDSPGDVD